MDNIKKGFTFSNQKALKNKENKTVLYINQTSIWFKASAKVLV